MLTIETSPSPAGRSPQRAGTHAKCVRILHGARGRVGAPHEKGGCLFHGNPGRGEQSLMNQNYCFSIDCCPHPNPSLLLRKQYLSLRERYVSQRDKHCSRSERGARSLDCQHALKPDTALRRLSAPQSSSADRGLGGVKTRIYLWFCAFLHCDILLFIQKMRKNPQKKDRRPAFFRENSRYNAKC